MVEEYDYLISNVKIVDGVSKAYTGSIGTKGERITAVGDVSGDAVVTLEGENLVAMPGFVDSHSHADGSFPYYPDCESAVMQGCTTVIAGQCGFSPAPLKELIRPPRVLSDELFELEPFVYHRTSSLRPIDEVNEMLKEKLGWTIEWKTMKEYFDFVNAKGIS
ncbi:unnamed protein product, partial [marine sediment metagenome]